MFVTTDTFKSYAEGCIRPLSWQVEVSFDKRVTGDFCWLTLDDSEQGLDGPCVLAPDGDLSAPEVEGPVWNFYNYVDYSDRVIDIEVNKEETEPYSIRRSTADITFRNEDCFFTPGTNSSLGDFILPRRPFRIWLGFGGENVQQFIGLTEKMPEISKKDGTATFHLVDFMTAMFEQELGQDIIMEDVRTDQILVRLFSSIGVPPNLYDFEPGLNTVRFFLAQAEQTLGEVVEKLMEAEIGIIYMDEEGIIKFRNRLSEGLVQVWKFDDNNTLSYEFNAEDYLINHVKITADVRTRQRHTRIWESGETIEIKAGESVDVWADYGGDPVLSVEEPVYAPQEINQSYYIASNDREGQNAYTKVQLTRMDEFPTSAKMVFKNNGTLTAYLTRIVLFGDAALVTNRISVEAADEDSIQKFQDRLYTIDNEYIQDEDNARSRAEMLLNDYSKFGNVFDLDVKGTPALQLRDVVRIDIDKNRCCEGEFQCGIDGLFRVMRITNTYTGNGALFRQSIRVRKMSEADICWVTLDVEGQGLDGPCMLAP